MVHYLKISKSEATLIVDRENGIVLVANLLPEWEDNLRVLLRRIADIFELEVKDLVVVQFVPLTGKWRIAPVDGVQTLYPVWEEVGEQEEKSIVQLLSHSLDRVMLTDKTMTSLLQMGNSAKTR